MSNRFWLWLLLTFALLAPVRLATAQNPGYACSIFELPSKQSHDDLPGGLDLDNPQEMMAQRLQELRELHQLQDQVQKLLADCEVVESFKQLSPEDLKRLQEKILKGEGLQTNRAWQELLQQAGVPQKLEKKIELLHRLAKHNAHTRLSPGEDFTPNARALVPPISPPSPNPFGPAHAPPTTEAPEPTLLERMQEESTQWLMEHLDDAGDDVLEALTEVGATEKGAPLAELLRSLQQPDFSEMNVGEPAMGLSQYLTDVGEFLHEQRGAWEEVHSLLRAAPVPSLPGFGGPSASVSASAAADGEDWVPALLSLLIFGAIVLSLLCKMAARSQAQTGSGEADTWRLGSWPVSPSAVATRQDVVRAFEYLALLCLGPAAGACHHRQLAERLAEQDSGNPARRQAAEVLAWLYEQARYAPAGESLSHDQLTEARHALCFLAGVTTA